MRTDAADEARSYGRSAGLLTVALGVGGALTYLFFAVASHSLPPDEYGQIVVLWSASFLLISVLFRPVEQLLARTVADLEERGRPIGHACRGAALIQLLLLALFTVLVFALREQIEDELFDGASLYFHCLVGTVIAYSASLYARGFFAGSHRMSAYAALIVVDGVARLTLALAVAVGISSGTTLVAIAIAIAPAASLAVVPWALARPNPRRSPSHPATVPATNAESAAEFSLAKGGGFAIAVLLIMLSEQVLLNGGVLFVRAVESAAAAGFIFNVLMVARAPVVLFQAIAASLLPHLTRLRSRGDEASGDAFALSVKLTILVIAVFATAIVIGLLAVGPAAMQIGFGDSFEYDRLGLIIVGIGMGLYLVAGTLTQAALAQGQAKGAALLWLACAASFAGFNLLPTLDAFRRVELGFALSSALLCVGLAAIYRRSTPRDEDLLAPGSPQELEAQLALADETT